MNANVQSNRRAVSEDARARVRRVTSGIVIASIAIVGTIAGYVAHGSTHKKSAGAAASPAANRVVVPSAPAAPSLRAPGEPSPDQSQAISPPPQVPSSTQQPPAATSGAS
ncbi:MAG: hypothetical protein ACM3QU_04055 [Verrucomicrobiota bacterium]